MSKGPGNEVESNIAIKRAPCKARQSPPLPFMITGEAKTTKQNKTTKYGFNHLIDGTRWFFMGTWDSSFFMG